MYKSALSKSYISYKFNACLWMCVCVCARGWRVGSAAIENISHGTAHAMRECAFREITLSLFILMGFIVSSIFFSCGFLFVSGFRCLFVWS